MAAGTIAAPGTEAGPCTEPCEHFDCKMARADAASPCQICGKPIGFETRHYLAAGAIGRQFVHALCLEARVAWVPKKLVTPAGFGPSGEGK